jgi:hypothetical protein
MAWLIACLALGGMVGVLAPERSAPASPARPSTRRPKPPNRADGAANPFTAGAMKSYLAGRSGTVTAALFDVSTGQTFVYHPGVTEQTASIVKVDILATLLWEAQTTPRPLTDDEEDLAAGMIEDSDNDDASTLWSEDGGSPAISHFDQLAGLSDTAPNPEGYWGETTTTALDQVELLKRLVLPNTLLDPASRAYELALMENVVGYERWGVSNGPTPGTTVALKNGWLPLSGDDWQINSIGYVDGDGRDYVLAVLTTDDPTEDFGIGTIDGVSRLVWLTLNRPPPSHQPD